MCLVFRAYFCCKLTTKYQSMAHILAINHPYLKGQTFNLFSADLVGQDPSVVVSMPLGFVRVPVTDIAFVGEVPQALWQQFSDFVRVSVFEGGRVTADYYTAGKNKKALETILADKYPKGVLAASFSNTDGQWVIDYAG